MFSFRIKNLMIMVFMMISLIQNVNATAFRLIKELLQNNVAGEPIVHETTLWNFDPQISEKRRPVYYELHGYRGSKFTERIGAGIDGHEQERYAAQAVRDQGRLNGEHVLNFP